MFVGFAGGAYKQETDVTLERGQTATLDRYTVRFDGLTQASDAQKDIVAARLSVLVGGKPYLQMEPAKWAFHHHEDEPPTTEVDIHKTAKEDLYLVLNGYEVQGNSQIANLKIVINPLVNWIWIGFVLLAIGTVIAFLPDRAYALAGAAAKSDKSTAVVAGLLALLMLGGVARAQNADAPMARATGGTYTARNERERQLFEKIVCMCGTCGRQALSECACGTAAEMRHKIQGLLDAGKSDDDVIQYELATYPGQSALVVPIDKGFNRLAWLLPYAALLAAVGGLVVVARRWTRRPRAARAPEPTATGPLSDADQAYADKLDDELDELD
jgi:cytochrome c-type biogenesis protein CcmF